ncbi:MAG: hypothetical protein NC177_13525 [Ruminococcus flavefaciens]|nr:hypothetical protein [Ruminococcus flavefaciens]
MITYDIDMTEDEYVHFEGETLEELKEFLYPDRFMDCCGYIDDRENCIGIALASVKEYGVFLAYHSDGKTNLSLHDKNNLEELVDVWGDGLYVSAGLFIPPEIAWQCICEFVTTGSIHYNIKWISPDDLPDGANYIE